MSTIKIVTREWVEAILADEVRLRCMYQRQGKEILRFMVQLEMNCQSDWKPMVRYENAHGFCHRDTLHVDGTQEKVAVFVGDCNTTFTCAIEELQASWQAHRDRFVRGMQS